MKVATSYGNVPNLLRVNDRVFKLHSCTYGHPELRAETGIVYSGLTSAYFYHTYIHRVAGTLFVCVNKIP
jgi:hypothetical protein